LGDTPPRARIRRERWLDVASEELGLRRWISAETRERLMEEKLDSLLASITSAAPPAATTNYLLPAWMIPRLLRASASDVAVASAVRSVMGPEWSRPHTSKESTST
jgi:hypothetical protein